MVDSGVPQKAKRTLDCIGLYCPLPILKTREAIEKLAIGETLEVLADDPAAEEDIKAWAKRAGQKLLEFEPKTSSKKILTKTYFSNPLLQLYIVVGGPNLCVLKGIKCLIDRNLRVVRSKEN